MIAPPRQDIAANRGYWFAFLNWQWYPTSQKALRKRLALVISTSLASVLPSSESTDLLMVAPSLGEYTEPMGLELPRTSQDARLASLPAHPQLGTSIDLRFPLKKSLPMVRLSYSVVWCKGATGLVESDALSLVVGSVCTCACILSASLTKPVA
jgi:hypothetical protein